jgi:hypothetical protein
MSINWRELQAVVHALDENAVSWRGKTILVRSDSVTTCALINKQGSRVHAHLHKLVCKLLYLCQTHRIRIFARHIADKDNQLADLLSRQMLTPQNEVQLPIEIFRQLEKEFGRRTIDLFASETNRQTALYYSLNHEESAKGTDAMNHHWPPGSHA